MPVKWGHNQDHHLLLKILETHPNIKLDYEKVAEARCDGSTKPTARAVKERLANIRKLAKSGLAAPRRTATAANGVNRTAPVPSISATPLKNSKAGVALPTPPTTSSRKCRLSSNSDEAELTDESEADEYQENLNNFFKTPSKGMDKMRLRAVSPRRYTLEGEEELGTVISDDSDFDPNAERKKEERMARRRRGIAGDSSDEC